MSLKALIVGGHVSLIGASLSPSGTGLDPLLLTGRGITVDHQLGAWAQGLPFKPRSSGFCLVLRTEFLGKLPDVLDPIYGAAGRSR
jgi:hypothetical protein